MMIFFFSKVPGQVFVETNSEFRQIWERRVVQNLGGRQGPLEEGSPLSLPRNSGPCVVRQH